MSNPRAVKTGWIGVDLDGTLAHYDDWRGDDHIGAPVPAMKARVLKWILCGVEVRIFTARVSGPAREADAARVLIQAWCVEHLGVRLAVTCAKDKAMMELWDDRAIGVQRNLGLAFTRSNLLPSKHENIAGRPDLADADSASEQETAGQ